MSREHFKLLWYSTTVPNSKPARVDTKVPLIKTKPLLSLYFTALVIIVPWPRRRSQSNCNSGRWLVGTYCKVSVSVEVEEVDPICKMCRSCLLFTSSMVQLLAMRITAYMTECMLPNDYTFIDINHMSETQTTCFSNRFKGNSISHVFGKVDMNVITLTSAL